MDARCSWGVALFHESPSNHLKSDPNTLMPGEMCICPQHWQIWSFLLCNAVLDYLELRYLAEHEHVTTCHEFMPPGYGTMPNTSIPTLLLMRFYTYRMLNMYY